MVAIYCINGVDELQSEVLRHRAIRAESPYIDQYMVAKIGPDEAALLILDFYDLSNAAGVYEIFVLPQYRQQGIGTAVLLRAEKLARDLGRSEIRLEAHPIDWDIDQRRLLYWYAGHGYRPLDSTQGTLHKVLSCGRPSVQD